MGLFMRAGSAFIRIAACFQRLLVRGFIEARELLARDRGQDLCVASWRGAGVTEARLGEEVLGAIARRGRLGEDVEVTVARGHGDGGTILVIAECRIRVVGEALEDRNEGEGRQQTAR